MNANAKVRMLVGCSILVTVCQPTAYAGCPGSMGASHLGGGVSHTSVSPNVLKTQSGIQTTGTNFNSKITAQPSQFLPSIGSKIQTGGISLKDKLSISPS